MVTMILRDLVFYTLTSSNGFAEVVELLLQYGADLNWYKNSYYGTALHAASCRGYLDINTTIIVS